jgi:Cu-processing system permease protein
MMIGVSNVGTIAAKELRDAFRNRWFLIFTLAFAGLALALSLLGQPLGGRLQISGYSRTAASLINLVLLFVPLIGLTLGAANLAGERETGALAYLLAQPVNRTEVLLGKYLGQALALFATLSVGFGLAGVVMALQGQANSVNTYLLTVVLACLLALAMLSLGFLLSTTAHKTATAIGAALFLWLLLVFVGDLGIMGTAIVTQMPIQSAFYLTAANPLQMFKIASILSVQANLDVLGPAGIYAASHYGASLLPLLLVGLIMWIIAPLTAALYIFGRQEKLISKGIVK